MSAIALRMQRGVSLIEVLVSLVIVAIGMLGVAGLFMSSARGAVDSVYRTNAAQAAYEMADRIRANPAAVSAGNYTTNVIIATNASPARDCSANACSASQMANWDLVTWARSLTDPSIAGNAQNRAARLPQGAGAVCRTSTPDAGSAANPACDGAAGAPIVIKVFWTERAMNSTEAAGGAVQQRRFVLNFVPAVLP